MVKRKFHITEKFDLSTLRKYYLRLGVRYRKLSYDYQQKTQRAAEIQLKQKEFVHNLTICMMEQRREIIYIDETTFNLWQIPSRTWLAKGMKVQIAESRGKSITLIGAISRERGVIHYQLVVGSNNADTFAKFINGL